MLVVENIQKVVGTVHLVTNGNFFVAAAQRNICQTLRMLQPFWLASSTGIYVLTQGNRWDSWSWSIDRANMECVFSCTHTSSVGWGRFKNVFTVWSNSQACRQIHMSERTPWAFHFKVNVNKSRPSSRARPHQRALPPTHGAFIWAERRPEPPGPALDGWRPGNTLSLRDQEGAGWL